MTADRTTRQAAIWATAVAVPLALLVGFLFFRSLDRGLTGGAAPSPSATATPRPGSTAPVTVAAPALSARAEVVCRALVSQLPQTVRGLAPRPVTAGPEQNAAYGDPPITLSCGVPAPTVAPTETVYPLDRVCWRAAQTPAATVWTTVDREVPVQVAVPRSYEEPGQWVNEFSGTVIETVPSTRGRIPAGCGA